MATDKVAIVTGGAEGIGKAISRVLLKHKYKVGILDVNESVGKETAEEFSSQFGSGSCVFYKCDVTKTEQLKECFVCVEREFGKVNMVVNNAGVLNEDNWKKMIDINLTAYIDMTYIAVDKMRKDKGGNGGTIVNVASMAGMGQFAGFPVYSSTKWAVIGFTKTMQESLDQAEADWGISLLSLCPAFVDTSLVRAAGASNFQAGVSSHVPREPIADKMQQGVEAGGLISLDELAEAFDRLIQDNKRGSVMLLVRTNGVTKHSYVQQTWSQV